MELHAFFTSSLGGGVPVSFKPQPLYLRVKNQSNHWLLDYEWHVFRSGGCGEETSLWTVPANEPLFLGLAARMLVTIPTEVRCVLQKA